MNVFIWATILFTTQIISFAQLTYPGCPTVTESDFRRVTLIQRGTPAQGVEDPTLREPIQMDFIPVIQNDSVAKVHIMFVERQGIVKLYNDLTKSVSVVGTLSVRTGTDHGLTGIALAPDYESSGHVYLWYSPADGATRMRLSRFIIENNQLNLGSEFVLLEILSSGAGNHHGGPMIFDAKGDLWITVGNDSPDQDPNGFSHVSTTNKNASDEWGSSNTASLRGSVLRIHPDPTDPKGYTIPSNNFGEYWATQFEQSGNSSLASQYRDTSLVYPEIYTKGHRTPFSITVDPLTGWAAIGEVGPWLVRDPNAPSGPHNTEELSLLREPLFGGYPYFSGNHLSTGGHTQDPNAPVNNSPFNTGVQNLPPAAVPTYAYGTAAGDGILAITGPIYRYNPNLKSSVKLPPHFDGKWFFADFELNWIKVLSIDGTGETAIPDLEFFSNMGLNAPLDFHLGPDGTLYLINYAGKFSFSNETAIFKIEYTGSCQLTPTVEKKQTNTLTFSQNSIQFKNQGHHSIQLSDVRGRPIHTITGEGKKTYDLKEELKNKTGLYLWSAKSGGKKFQGKIVIP